MAESENNATLESRQPQRLMIWLLLATVLTIVTGTTVICVRNRAWMHHVAVIESSDVNPETLLFGLAGRYEDLLDSLDDPSFRGGGSY